MRLFILIALLTTTLSSFGQVSFGPKIGVCQTSISETFVTKEASPIVGISAGGFANIKILKALSFQGEVLYSQRGYRFSEKNISLNYIDIPLVVQFSFGEKISPFINLGASPSFLMSNKSNRINSFDLGIIAAPGIKIKLGQKISTFIEARYYYGTSAVYKGINSYNRSIGIYAGLVF